MGDNVKIDWVEINPFKGLTYHIGLSGTVRLFAIQPQLYGFVLLTDLPGIKDRYEARQTVDEQKRRAEVVFEKWLEMAGFGPVK